MTFKLEADGVHFWASSPAVTRKLVLKGARLVDATQAEHLRLVMECGAPTEERPPEPPRSPDR